MRVLPFPRALAVVAAHGATDFNEMSCMWEYAAVCAVMRFSPAWLTMTVFLSSSFVHFARDVGESVSCALHACVAMVGLHRGPTAAFSAMTAYMLFVHVPAHYIRCYRNKRFVGLFAAASATATFLARPDFLVVEGSFYVTELVQKIVIAHVLHEIKISKR